MRFGIELAPAESTVISGKIEEQRKNRPAQEKLLEELAQAGLDLSKMDDRKYDMAPRHPTGSCTICNDCGAGSAVCRTGSG